MLYEELYLNIIYLLNVVMAFVLNQNLRFDNAYND